MSNCKSVLMTVKGKTREVWLRSNIAPNKWRARTYVNGKTVSGTLSLLSNGTRRFAADGKNASLLK
jgi:hypothetical protein